jgi:predicted nucleic acid-binding protein
VIADTSVWIDWLRGDDNPPAHLLQAELDAGHAVYALPVIIQEILQGARSPRHYHELDRELSRLRVDVSLNGLKVARAAAYVYARCRWAAFTPRHTNDCLIAASCVLLDMPLLHNDRDFLSIARVETALKLIPASAP